MWLMTVALAAPLTLADAVPGALPGALPGVWRAPADLAPPTAIINGEPAEKSDWPMTGAMLVKAELRAYGGITIIQPICSSTLIAPDTVLLAAHCVDELVLQLSLGQTDSIEFAFEANADMSYYTQQLRGDYRAAAAPAARAVKHPDFNVLSFNSNLGVARNNDIALLFLAEPLLDHELGYVIDPSEVDQIEEGLQVSVVGWGQRDPDNPYLSGLKYMGESVINELGPWEMQIGAQASDVRKCHGDSGGPTFLGVESDSADPFRVIGVTSHAYDLTDCDSKGGVDTRVDAFYDWIDETMREGCADGWRSWCEYEGVLQPPDREGYDVFEPEYNTAGDDATGDDDDADDASGDSESAKGGCSTAPFGGAALALVALLATRRRR